MKVSKVVHKANAQIGHAGLGFIGAMAEISGVLDEADRYCPREQPQIQERDIILSISVLIAQGKTDFEQIREYKEDEFFKNILGIEQIASAETLRQRFQDLALKTKWAEKLGECSVRLWQKTGMRAEIIKKGKREWVRLDIDTSIFDNKDTKKEGTNYTYTNEYGYGPIFAYLGGG